MINVSSSVERDRIISDLTPDLTPLLDVVFMLIIFLVLTINSMPQAFDIALPEDDNDVLKDIKTNDTIAITLFAKQKQWGLDDRKFDDFELFKKALVNKYEASAKKHVIVFGDKDASINSLMNLLTFMRSKGIEAADMVMK